MAQSGIPYFPLDCHLDEKFELIEAEFGLTGFAVVVKLYQRIYGREGYYCEWTNDVALLFAKNVGLGGNAVSEIVTATIRRGIFDKALFDKYSILTSKGIQERYFDAVSRRKSVKVENDYLLLCNTQIPKNVDISGGNVYISSENVDISKQSKGEKSKEEYSKGEESKVTHADLVRLTPTEYKSLVSEFGEEDTNHCIEELNLWKQGGKGRDKNYDDYRAIKRWVIIRVEEQKAKGKYKKGSFETNQLEENAMKKYRRENDD